MQPSQPHCCCPLRKVRWACWHKFRPPVDQPRSNKSLCRTTHHKCNGVQSQKLYLCEANHHKCCFTICATELNPAGKNALLPPGLSCECLWSNDTNSCFD